MLILPPPKFRKARRRMSGLAAHQILRVSHDTATNKLSVILSGTLSEEVSFASAIQASSDGVTWVASTGGNFSTPPQALFVFAASVAAKTQWRIVDPSVWVFDDGRPLTGAVSGTIV